MLLFLYNEKKLLETVYIYNIINKKKQNISPISQMEGKLLPLDSGLLDDPTLASCISYKRVGLLSSLE